MERTKEKMAETLGALYIYIYIDIFTQKNCYTV